MASIKKNFMYQTVLQILLMILPFITSPYLARVIGAEGVGIYSYTYSFASYFIIISKLGIDRYGARVIAQNRNNNNLNEIFSNLFYVHAIISFCVIVSYAGYVVFFAEYKLIATIQAVYIFASMIDICWFFVGLEKFKFTVIREMTIKIIALILIVTLVKNKNDLIIYIIIMVASSLASAVFLWVYIFKFVKFTKPSWNNMKIHLKPMIILFVPAIMENLYVTIDKIMLGSMCSKVSVGLYENAEKAMMTKRIISAVGVVATPKMSVLFAEQKVAEIRRFINKSLKLTMALSFAFAFGTAAIAYEFSVWFWGSEFQECGTIIIGLSLVIPIWTVGDVIRTQYLIPQNLDKQYIASVCVGTVVNILLNYILIPIIGIKGAVLGTMFSEIVVVICQAITIKSHFSVLKAVKPTLIYGLIGIVMYIVLYPIKYCFDSVFLNMIAKIVLGVGIFTLLSYIYSKKYDKEMINLMISIIRKERR